MKKTILVMAIMLLTFNVAAQQSQNVNVELKKTEPVPLQSSEYATVWLEVTNDGTSSARNVDIEFLENYPFSVDPDEKKQWDITELTPGEEYQLRLQVRVDENAVQGNNSMDFRVRHGGSAITEEVSVEVRSDNNILSVEDIDFPETVAPGSPGEMKITFTNLADGQLKNIEVSLDVSSSSLPFATSKSAVKNIQRIDSGESENVTYVINVDETAENGVYKLPIEMNYENEAGTSFEQSTTTGVMVGGDPQLEVAINNENQVTRGSTETLTFRVVNRGHGSANFVQMGIESNNEFTVLSPDTAYLGDMDSDDFQTAEYSVHVSKDAGNLTIPVELSYSDRSGERVETQNIEMRVYSKEELQQLGISQNSNIIPIAAGAVVIILIMLFIWRRRRKKKR